MAESHLLHADEEQIDRALPAIGDGTAFIVAVCPADVRQAALRYLGTRLTGLTLADPVEVGTPDEMFGALAEQAERKERVLPLTLGRDVLGAFDALNLHREKVLKGGPVILWLDDVEHLRTMRERAPDAYSFRTTMMLLRGDGGVLPMAPTEESEKIAALRKRLKRARTPFIRAAEGLNLAEALRSVGKLNEAAEVARAALLAMPHAATDEERNIRSILCRSLALIEIWRGSFAQGHFWLKRGLAELEAFSSYTKSLEMRVRILAEWLGPIGGYDRTRVLAALSLVRRFGLPLRQYGRALSSCAQIAVVQGDLQRARDFLEEEGARAVVASDITVRRSLTQGDLLFRAGKLAEAETEYRSAAATASIDSLSGRPAANRLLSCMGTRGELDATERLAHDEDTSTTAWGTRRHTRAMLATVRGDIDDARLEFHALYVDAKREGRDGDILQIFSGIVNAALETHRAHRLSSETMASILSDLEMARDVVLELSGSDGPEWYQIRLNSEFAQVLRIAGKTDEALDILRQTLELARNTYPDLVPETGRILADHLLYARMFDEVLPLIDETEPVAAEKGFLEERARLIANRVLALVGKNTPHESIQVQMDSLRDALAATDSKRITAETLLPLAERLPPATTFPDPISLADEAHRLFVAMPIPAEEARCLEIIGDVLVVRRQYADALARYGTARGRLERHGLLLRVPLLDEKIHQTNSSLTGAFASPSS